MQLLSTGLIFDGSTAPDLLWNPGAKRYVYADSKRFVSQSAVRSLQQQHVIRIQADIATLGDLLISRKISLATWQESMRETLKALHVGQLLLARGGKGNTTAADYLQIGRVLKQEYKYLQQFAIDIRNGYSLGKDGREIPLSVARFTDRLGKYALHSRISFEYGELANQKDLGMLYEQRFLGIAKHCNGCVEEAARGKQPIGELKRIGNCECGGRCHCNMQYFKS